MKNLLQASSPSGVYPKILPFRQMRKPVLLVWQTGNWSVYQCPENFFQWGKTGKEWRRQNCFDPALAVHTVSRQYVKKRCRHGRRFLILMILMMTEVHDEQSSGERPGP